MNITKFLVFDEIVLPFGTVCKMIVDVMNKLFNAFWQLIGSGGTA